jgi:hypothetical protein
MLGSSILSFFLHENNVADNKKNKNKFFIGKKRRPLSGPSVN